MKLTDTLLTLAVASALATGGAFTTPAQADAVMASTRVATTAPMSSDSDAAERAREAAEDANEAANEANEAANEAAEEANEDHHDVAPANGMGRRQIIDMLTAAGYTDIEDVQMDDAVWTAEAKDPATGKHVDLKIDPVDGHILSKTD